MAMLKESFTNSCCIAICLTSFMLFTGVSISFAQYRIGANYGQIANNLIPPGEVLKLIKSSSIGKVKLYNADPGILRTFAGSNIPIVVGIGNEIISSLTDPSVAQKWVDQNVAAYLPGTPISGIAVGNEVLTSNDAQLSSHLVPAMKNLHTALIYLGLDERLKVSTPHSLGVLSISYPPSAGSFRSDIATSAMKPVLDFLSRTGSAFMVNAYPFFAYKSNPTNVSLDYCLFRAATGITDPNTNLIYTNMLDAMVDAVYSAMDSLGYNGVGIVVSETGWPSSGDENETGASVENAMSYNRNLIAHLSSGKGTPLKPDASTEAFIFALFNENQKSGPSSERNYGLFTPSGLPVYDAGLVRSSPSAAGSPSSQAPESNSSHEAAWCIAKNETDASVLLSGINFACGVGGADCSAIQSSGSCYDPPTLASHASYAYNDYYQKRGRNPWNCDFDGTAVVSTTDPSYGSCQYLLKR
ncbi:hypothetical protein O6H91_05G090900 [Diphasiastrum complanatum]|uniref:Uncharacterized protein n=2 Tax=Diphasiastrum complanatum TaxID=34168 RepID=A0ACC2DR19_DIPCM|nr:hypothetical protein O6H91_05G090900 [Diphasiastrum complanatum]